VRLREGSLHLHRRFARGEAAEILEPGTDRVTPACPHYIQDQCGGCQLQHLTYAAQLAAKRAIVGDALRRIGKIDVSDPEIVPAAAVWRYQTMLSLEVRGSTIGLHPHDRPGRVFPLVDCHVAHPMLVELWNDLKSRLELFPERLTRISLRLDRDGVRHVIVESAGEPWLTAHRLREAVSPVNTIVCWWQPVDGAARVVAGPETGFPPIAFEVLHPAVVSDAGHWAMEAVGPVSGQTAWDLYGGSGDIGVELALRGATVISVDGDEKAIGWARRRPDAAQCGERLRFIAGRVEDVLPSLPPPQLVVANPPSTGLHWDVSLRLAGEPVSRLVYLSRHPATLARDLHRLNVNYQVRAVRAFDLAPQTATVLVVAVLEAV
jgi:23S rRNA (uracil1939-C5)-methyltransferase